MDKPLTPRNIIRNQLAAAVISFIGGALISILLMFPIKWLWNWLMPGLADLPAISAVEAWGISFLARLIFPTVVSLPKKEKQQVTN